MKITISDGTGDNRLFLAPSGTPDYWQIGLEGSDGGIYNTNFTTTTPQNEWNIIKCKYKSGDVAVKVNGVEIFTNPRVFTMVGLDRLHFAKSSGDGDYFYGEVEYVKYYKDITNY